MSQQKTTLSDEMMAIIHGHVAHEDKRERYQESLQRYGVPHMPHDEAPGRLACCEQRVAVAERCCAAAASAWVIYDMHAARGSCNMDPLATTSLAWRSQVPTASVCGKDMHLPLTKPYSDSKPFCVDCCVLCCNARWWRDYSHRKNDEEDMVADSLLYDERCHLPRTTAGPKQQPEPEVAAAAAAAANKAASEDKAA